MAQNNEASVEEILDSIKKVIARDNRAGATDARRRRFDAAQNVEPEQNSEPPTNTMEPRHPARNDEDVLDLSGMDFADFSEEDREPGDAPLITERVRGAMQENLAALALLAEPGAKPQIVRSGETSLEGLTRELLRPMLAQWLDENLPTLVEKLVQAEIARIVGKHR